MGWGGRSFEAGRLLTFSAFSMGAYSRWALIRGWALIRINTVLENGTVIEDVLVALELEKFVELYFLLLTDISGKMVVGCP